VAQLENQHDGRLARLRRLRRLEQVVGYTGHYANIVAEAALDPTATLALPAASKSR
jgi:hypothetical protein